MIQEYPELKALELEDISIIDENLKLFPRTICELTLSNIFMWKDSDRTQLTRINGNLCLFLDTANEGSYSLEPLGHNLPDETVAVCLKHAKRLSRVSEDLIKLLKPEGLKITELRSQFDYIYATKDLAELKGKNFDGKRNHIKRFTRKFPEYQFVPLASGLKKEAMELFEKWFQERKNSGDHSDFAYTSQKSALLLAFDDLESLQLKGGALMADGKLKGFTMGSRLNEETDCIHFSYVDPDIEGATQVLLWETMKKIAPIFKYVNLEQDLGLPGLRKTKLSYHPLKLEKKFEVEVQA